MLLIFEHTWGGEPCPITEIFPVEYSSKDALIADFRAACEKAMRESTKIDFFIGQEFYPSDFMYRDVKKSKKSDKEKIELVYGGPTVYTLEEWLQERTLYVDGPRSI